MIGARHLVDGLIDRLRHARRGVREGFAEATEQSIAGIGAYNAGQQDLNG